MRRIAPFERALTLAIACAVLLVVVPSLASGDSALKVTVPSASQTLLIAKHTAPHGGSGVKSCTRFETPVEYARCITPSSVRPIVTTSLLPPRLPMPEWRGLRNVYASADDLGHKHWW